MEDTKATVRLKEQFGADLILLGTICTRTLAFGTPEDVRAETIERMDTAKQYGGMMLMPCNRPVELPFENLVAYLQAAEEHCIV